MPGSVIKRYREMKDFSQKYVASKMGISQNAYSKIENNITQLTVQHVKALSEILEVPVTELLRDDFEIHKPVTMPAHVTKAELLKHLDILHKKIESRHASRHHGYIAAMSLILAAEATINNIH